MQYAIELTVHHLTTLTAGATGFLVNYVTTSAIKPAKWPVELIRTTDNEVRCLARARFPKFRLQQHEQRTTTQPLITNRQLHHITTALNRRKPDAWLPKAGGNAEPDFALYRHAFAVRLHKAGHYSSANQYTHTFLCKTQANADSRG